jgi:GT2 family glycosyltransferase
MLVRLPSYVTAGGFDEDLITYADDLDFSIRMREAGFAIVHVPDAEVTHGESRNVIAKAGKQFRDYFNMRNQLIIAWRHGGLLQRAVGVPVAVLTSGVLPACVHLLRGDGARTKALMLGIVDFLRGRTGWGSL